MGYCEHRIIKSARKHVGDDIILLCKTILSIIILFYFVIGDVVLFLHWRTFSSAFDSKTTYEPKHKDQIQYAAIVSPFLISSRRCFLKWYCMYFQMKWLISFVVRDYYVVTYNWFHNLRRSEENREKTTDDLLDQMQRLSQEMRALSALEQFDENDQLQPRHTFAVRRRNSI